MQARELSDHCFSSAKASIDIESLPPADSGRLLCCPYATEKISEKKLYEAYAGEKISEKRFELLFGEYERERDKQNACVAAHTLLVTAFLV